MKEIGESSNSNNERRMTVEEVQNLVHDLITRLGGYWPSFELLAAVVEEVGELSKSLQLLEGSRSVSVDISFQKLEEELGDVFFALICLANAYKIRLDTALGKTVTKYEHRGN